MLEQIYVIGVIIATMLSVIIISVALCVIAIIVGIDVICVGGYLLLILVRGFKAPKGFLPQIYRLFTAPKRAASKAIDVAISPAVWAMKKIDEEGKGN